MGKKRSNKSDECGQRMIKTEIGKKKKTLGRIDQTENGSINSRLDRPFSVRLAFLGGEASRLCGGLSPILVFSMLKNTF